MRSGGRAAWGSVVAGVASVAALPLAIYLTRFSDSYDLLHAGFAIPVAAGLGFVAVALARRARAREAVSLSGNGKSGLIAILLARTERRRSSVSLTVDGGRVALVGRILGIVGICLAASALVALGVYGLLQYVGSRD